MKSLSIPTSRSVAAWLRALACVLLGLAAAPAQAVNPDDVPTYDRGAAGKPGKQAEPARALPLFPRTENLAHLDGGDIDSDYEYWIDLESVAVEDDGTVRYTLVMRAPRGAANVFNEGFRCDQHSFKSFAYGTREGRFKAYDNPQWESVERHQRKRSRSYLWLLYSRYFCGTDGTRSTLRDIRKRLGGQVTVTGSAWKNARER